MTGGWYFAQFHRLQIHLGRFYSLTRTCCASQSQRWFYPVKSKPKQRRPTCWLLFPSVAQAAKTPGFANHFNHFSSKKHQTFAGFGFFNVWICSFWLSYMKTKRGMFGFWTEEANWRRHVRLWKLMMSFFWSATVSFTDGPQMKVKWTQRASRAAAVLLVTDSPSLSWCFDYGGEAHWLQSSLQNLPQLFSRDLNVEAAADDSLYFHPRLSAFRTFLHSFIQPFSSINCLFGCVDE